MVERRKVNNKDGPPPAFSGSCCVVVTDSDDLFHYSLDGTDVLNEELEKDSDERLAAHPGRKLSISLVVGGGGW